MPPHLGGSVGEHGHRGQGLGRVGEVGQVDVDAAQGAGAPHLGEVVARSTAAPIRSSTSHEAQVALQRGRTQAVDPHPAAEMAAAAKKYDAADASGSMA